MVQTPMSIAQLAMLASSSCTFTVVNNYTNRISAGDFEIHVKTLQTRVLHEPTPSLSIARNTGISDIDADYVFITEDDVTVPTHWVARYETAFRRYPDAGFLSSDYSADFG